MGRRSAPLKCLECHTEIRERIAQRRGMHPTYAGANATGADCARCHSEHNGSDFPLIRWEPKREAIEHNKTGFPLEGRHAGIACSSCHKAENIPAAARAGIQVKDLNRTYLGLSRDCASCHKDEHHGQLGANCTRCHSVNEWKPAAGFDHANTKYPLTGLHARVACQKCHPMLADAKPYAKYAGISFAKCTPCHTDPHKGSFTAPCASCHTTAGWTRVAQLEGFDHAKTKFPLLGKHEKVACSDCHMKGDFKAPVAHAKCIDCHQDAHRGQFSGRPGSIECAGCHTVDGWKPSTFGVKEHANTQYALEGRHTKVTCDKCHLPKGRETVFKITQTGCKDCHQDIHARQFAAAPHHNRCEACHNVAGFRPARFALARHNSTRFPLTGAHSAIPCAGCHKPPPAGSRDAVKFRFEDRTCTGCHTDPHRGEFRTQMESRRPDGTNAGCEACHSVARWKELVRFDHAQTAFPLTGGHRGVACIDCHRPPNLETTLKNVDFRAAPTECSGCHTDAHAGQFAARKDAADCSSCHETGRWKPAVFDHNRRTPFSLEGEHRNVACTDCHKLTREVAGKAVVFYKPTPRECKECHASLKPTAQLRSPAVHLFLSHEVVALPCPQTGPADSCSSQPWNLISARPAVRQRSGLGVLRRTPCLV